MVVSDWSDALKLPISPLGPDHDMVDFHWDYIMFESELKIDLAFFVSSFVAGR